MYYYVEKTLDASKDALKLNFRDLNDFKSLQILKYYFPTPENQYIQQFFSVLSNGTGFTAVGPIGE